MNLTKGTSKGWRSEANNVAGCIVAPQKIWSEMLRHGKKYWKGKHWNGKNVAVEYSMVRVIIKRNNNKYKIINAVEY